MGELSNRRACASCLDGKALDFDFSMAFQPIVDLRTSTFAAGRPLDSSVTQARLCSRPHLKWTDRSVTSAAAAT